MKTVAITNVRLIDPATGTDERGGIVFSCDEAMETGRILDVGSHLADKAEAEDVIDGSGHVLAPGVIDLRAKTGEPGAEHKETLATASRAAAAGGVTSFVVMPDTSPVIDTVALVDFVRRRARDTAAVRIYAAGGLTEGLAGERMTEIGLMQEAGAVMFSNGEQAVENPGLLRRVMQYAAGYDALIMTRPDVHALTRGTVMNACEYASQLGVKGAPSLAELIAVERDLTLAEMTGTRLLIDQVSTARALDAIERGRTRGINAACTVSAMHIFFNELDVGDYLTYCKVFPPFRSEDDRQAMIDGLARGVIDAVVSAHDPQPPENKRLPMSEATFGAIGLETIVPALLSLVHEEKLDLVQALRPLTCGPADVLGLPQGRLSIHAPADLMMINLNTPWECVREDLLSRSQNSPFDGRRLQGRVIRTFVGGKSVFERSPLTKA